MSYYRLRTSDYGLMGQATLEYAVLVGIVAAALVTMHSYVRRAMQANLKHIEQELNAVTR